MREVEAAESEGSELLEDPSQAAQAEQAFARASARQSWKEWLLRNSEKRGKGRPSRQEARRGLETDHRPFARGT
eukprot:4649999-Pyramimonas_sp.AAC.1